MTEPPAKGLQALRRIAAALGLLATLFFCGAACATQLLRPDLAPLRIPLSLYLAGPLGLLLHIAYYVLAAGVLLFLCAFHSALAAPRHNKTINVLLVLTAAAIVVTAAVHPVSATASYGMSGIRFGIHLFAAGVAFLAASIALTLAALRLQNFASRRFARAALVLAVIENLALLAYVFANTPWRGAQQKLVILLVIAALLAGLARCGRRLGLAAVKMED